MVLARREWFLLVLLLALDQATKYVALFFKPNNALFTLTWNTGAGFGILKGHNELFLLIGIVMLVLLWQLFAESKGHERIAYLVIGAGVIGNMLDRIVHQAVIDFISIWTFPIFNIADSCITLGVAYLVAVTLRDWFPAWNFRKGKTS